MVESLILQCERDGPQLNPGLRHLQQHKPDLNMFHIRMVKEHYRKFRKVVLEVDRDSATRLLTRESPVSITLSCLLTAVDSLRIPLDVYVRTPSPVPIVACGCRSPLLPSTANSTCQSIYPTKFYGFVTLPLFSFRRPRGVVPLAYRI